MDGGIAWSKVTRSELIAIAGGLLLAASLFFAWYHAKTTFASIPGHPHGPATDTGWEAHPILRWLLLAAAAAPLILTYIVVSGAALSWPRGEVTAVVAITAIIYNTLITRPGNTRGLVSLKAGVLIAIAGTVLMVYGAALRSSEVERGRKPPGTI
jgi:hypothetical protein